MLNDLQGVISLRSQDQAKIGQWDSHIMKWLPDLE